MQLCADLEGGVYVGAYVAYLSMCVAAVVVNSEQKKKPTFPVKNQLEYFLKNRSPNLPRSVIRAWGMKGGKAGQEGWEQGAGLCCQAIV